MYGCDIEMYLGYHIKKDKNTTYEQISTKPVQIWAARLIDKSGRLPADTAPCL
ncbi:hypothetical protein JYU34_007540 [Plutella xylostella]|uniref:Uncharacterized protein n=1 Tax=Plutella xylostella TaxID=51655 RepID=A0ABQ7QQT6_PLUXY|nr:hypothetical protein JYU34_007540 [Plutella xylostella]